MFFFCFLAHTAQGTKNMIRILQMVQVTLKYNCQNIYIYIFFHFEFSKNQQSFLFEKRRKKKIPLKVCPWTIKKPILIQSLRVLGHMREIKTFWSYRVLFHLYCFCVGRFRDISCKDICLLCNIMELESTLPVVLKASKKNKNKNQSLTPEIMTQLPKISHRFCFKHIFHLWCRSQSS